MVILIILCYLAVEMVDTKKKKKSYTGRNIRISDEAFNQIKEFVDIKGWKLGRFVEDAAMEKLKTEKEKK